MAKQKERVSRPSKPMKPMRPAGPVARNDAYTMLLFVTFVAIVTACVLLFVDFDEYGQQKAPSTSPPAIQKLGDADKIAPAASTNTGGSGANAKTGGNTTPPDDGN